MKILQITDPHLYGRADGRLRGVETDASLRGVLDDAFARFPDFAALLVTGDLVQDDPGGYLRFRSILGGVRQPVLCIPGNHDVPETMLRELAVAPFQIGGASRIGEWHLIMLDSFLAGQVGGRLAPAELDRLAAALALHPRAHTMVCLHHHPVAMGSHWLDGIGLANADAFWRIIDAHPQVRSVVWGHVHQEFAGLRGDVRLFATPSTCAQFLPASERYALDFRPPAFRSFELHADGRIETAVHWVDALAAPQAASRP
jgi:Icc protein